MKFIISGMSCAGCSSRVESVVSKLSGVTKCSVNLLTASMEVEGTATVDQIVNAVSAAGYGAELVNENSKKSPQNKSSIKTMIIRLVVSIIILAALIAIPAKVVKAILAAVVMIINYKYFINGVKGIIHLSPNMDTLVALGSTASFIFGMYDGAAMILTLITVGKTLEEYSKGKTTNAIKGLMKLTPEYAKDIKIDDIFTVKPGENFPVDGVVIEGNTSVNESAITGESVPIPKNPGDEVTSGTTNMDGVIKCRATRVGKDTTLAKIIQLVSDSAATKAPVQKIADKVAGVFVPVVLGISIITFVVWYLTNHDFNFALNRAISVLVISCPCSLGLATPVAIMVGNGVGAKQGILFKNSTALENAGKAEYIVLDKTGTITKGDIGVNRDSIRSDSASAVEELKKLGLKVVMLTGDNKTTAMEIAKAVGIETVISEVRPEQKAEEVRKLGCRVIMVGDGINDAPALTVANVGFAIGAGSDIAIDSADVVLVKNSLKDVVKAIKLSRYVYKNIKENLFWAFFYNVIGIPLAAGCFISLFGWTINPVYCAAAMSLSSFCVVMNALRINFFANIK